MKRLVIDGYGKFLGIRDEQIVVREKGKVISSSSPSELRQVIISGSGSLSTNAINKLVENNVDVLFIDYFGKVKARLSQPVLRTVETRRQQYKAYDDERGVLLSKQFVYAKLRNQMAVLGTLAKARKDYDKGSADILMKNRGEIGNNTKKILKIDGRCCEEVRGEIMGIEGYSATFYWSALSEIFPRELNFKDRSGRFAKDGINAMLNYGYGVLFGDVMRGIHFSGLDPYAGFLHADRPGKPSMALDLMEEFRQQLVDKVVIKLITKGQVKPQDFEIHGNSCRINDNLRRLLLRELLGKLESSITYQDKQLQWSNLILKQARSVAKYLRGESSYNGFYLRW